MKASQTAKLPPAKKLRPSVRGLIVLAALALIATACGGSDDSANSSAGSNTPRPSDRDDLRFPELTRNENVVRIGQIPGDAREVAASALRGNRNNPLFPDALIPIDKIISGGPPPDGIPPIILPNFERVSDIDWLEPQEAVIALVIDGDARAYPVRILISHEIVNDTFAELPVAVTYCPLCNSAVVYERQLDGRTFVFGTSGSLYNSALVMYDRQTESLWTHYDGRAVVGELAGAQLPLIAAATVSWETFRAEHPDGIVLSRETGFARNYGSNPYAGYDNPDDYPFLFTGRADERLAPKARVVGIRVGTPPLVIALDDLAAAGAIAFEVSGIDGRSGTADLVAWHLYGTATPLENSLVAFGRDVGATGVFFASADGQKLTFERNAGGDGFTDAETGSTWTLLGRATSGPLAGTQLEPVEHLDTFWFAFAAYNPGTQILS